MLLGVVMCGFLGAAAPDEGSALAPEADPPSLTEAGRLIFDEENDALAPGDNTDRYYTQGLRLQLWWSIQDPDARARLIRNLLPFEDGPPDAAMFGIVVGQSIYTPESFATRTVADLKGDRPFGGWAYAGVAALASWQGPRVGTRRLLLELDVGAYGDWSLAGPLQVGMHRLLREANGTCWDGDREIDSCRPLDPPGWHHPEIVMDPGVGVTAVARYETDVFVAALEASPDVAARVAVLVECSAGNVFDVCGLGVVGRAGWNADNLDTGVPGVIKLSAEEGLPTEAGLWIFGRAEGLAIGYNRFLDGDPFLPGGLRAARNVFIGEAEVGAMGRILGLELGCSVFMRSPELVAPPSGNGFQTVGRLRVGFFF